MLIIHNQKKFDYRVRVYYGDTDCGGIVYHANYLNFMERARSEWLIELGYNKNIMDKHDAFFAVLSVNLDFIKPAKLYDLLNIENEIIKINKASIELIQDIKNSEGFDICRGFVKLVCVNKEMKPRGIPDLLKRKIENDS